MSPAQLLHTIASHGFWLVFTQMSVHYSIYSYFVSWTTPASTAFKEVLERTILLLIRQLWHLLQETEDHLRALYTESNTSWRHPGVSVHLLVERECVVQQHAAPVQQPSLFKRCSCRSVRPRETATFGQLHEYQPALVTFLGMEFKYSVLRTESSVVQTILKKVMLHACGSSSDSLSI